MNRRQEIASWVFGLLLAVACASHGADESDFTVGVVAPLLIVGGLTVFSLRTRQADVVAVPKRTIAGALLVVFALATVGARGSVRDLEYRVEELESSVEDIKSTVDDLESKVDDLDRKIDDAL